MQVGIMVTDGGAHPPEKWARTTAYMLSHDLIRIDENSASQLAQELREARDHLNSKLYRILKPHHENVQGGERSALMANGSERLAKVDISEHVNVDAVLAAVVEEAKIHPLIFAHFSQDHVKDAIRQRLAMDFATVMHIEHSWHADRNPNDPHAQAFRAAHHTGAEV
jgi:hypothetical protein